MLLEQRANTSFQILSNKLTELIRSIFPISVQDRKLELLDVTIDKPNFTDLAFLQNSKRLEKSVAAPIHLKLRLSDKNNVIDTDTVLLGSIPVMTSIGTFLVEGNDYIIPNQLRLKPSVYTRELPDGRLQAKFNLKDGENFVIYFDPSEPSFTIAVPGKSFNLIALLKALNVPDSKLREAFGDLYPQLSAKASSVNLEDFLSRIKTSRYENLYQNLPSDPVQQTIAVLNTAKVDPEVTKVTIGKNYSNVSIDLILDTVKKLIAIANNQDEPSGMSSLLFKKMLSSEEQILEKFALTLRLAEKTIKDRMLKYNTIKQIVPPNYLLKPIDDFFKSSSVSHFSETLNVFSLASNPKKVSIMGEGAIEDENAVTHEDRALDPFSAAFLDPVHTPESDKIGAVTFMSFTARPGFLVDPNRFQGEIVNLFIDAKNKKTVLLRPIDLYGKVVAFPDALEKPVYILEENKPVQFKFKPDSKGFVPALVNGKVTLVEPSKVDYIIPSVLGMFGPSSNLLPFLDSLQGNRAMMASKHLTHILALANPEPPLVQAKIPGAPEKISLEHNMGRMFNIYSPVDGTVKKIENGKIVISSKEGTKEIGFLDNYPTVEGNFLSHKLLVKPGDNVVKGQLLAELSFTKDNAMAYGTNLKIAYMPYKGLNFEDGIVISESAAKKLASEHLFVYELDTSKFKLVSPNNFRASFPNIFTVQQLSNLSDDGIIKKGAKVTKGDPLILAVQENVPKFQEQLVGEKFRQKFAALANASVTFDDIDDGIVKDVVKLPNKVKVVVQTISPAKVGDKIVARHGNKGTIAAVIPDEQMPRDESGEPIEVIFNPIGVVSRINPSQLLEAAAGKVAKKIGQPIVVENFSDKNNVEFVKDLMKKYNVKEKERLTDPSGEPITEPVFTGIEYFVKLPQRAQVKTNIREQWGYDVDFQPLKGSEEEGAARAIDPLTFYSLVSHGAEKNLAEMSTYKAEKNDEFWLAIELGKVPPAPKPTFATEKFFSLLKAAGINVEKKGDELIVKPISEKDIKDLKPVKIQKPTLLSAHKLEPEPGGLFDPKGLGGVFGDKWGVIELPVPVLNPVFKDVVPYILGISLSDVDKLSSGKLAVNEKGEIVPANSPDAKYFAGEAFKKLFKQQLPSIDQKIQEVRQRIEKEPNPKKVGTLVKQFRMLNAIKNKQINPEDFVMSKVPVLPSKFRTVVDTGEMFLISPLNYAYRDLLLATNTLQEAKKNKVYDEKQFKQVAAELLDSQMEKLMFAVPQGKSAMEPKGIIPFIAGTGGPKTGFVHSKLFKKRQELSSTAVLQNGPELGLDQVAIPEDMAWNLYRPFIVRHLVSQGYDIGKANEMINNRTPEARKWLDYELSNRPVLVNRPPSLHKFNIQAFKPVVYKPEQNQQPDKNVFQTKQKTKQETTIAQKPMQNLMQQNTQEMVIRLNPLVMKGFNADNDGDTLGVFVPATEEARVEALEKLLPSKNVIRPVHGDVMILPRMEYVQGIFNITALPPKQATPKRNYGRNYQRLYEDWLKRIVASDDLVVFDRIPATVGKHLINGLFPRHIRQYSKPINSSELKRMIIMARPVLKDDFVNVVDTIKNIARIALTRHPVTLGLSDIYVPEISYKTKQIIEKEKTKIIKSPDKVNELTQKVDNILKEQADKMAKNNNLFKMMVSGAKGDILQIRQMIASPVGVQDTKGRNLPFVVENSYASGVKPSEYFASSFGSRVGMLSKKLGVAEPGAINKELLVNTSDLVVTQEDAPDDPGVPLNLSLDDKWIIGRVLANDVKAHGKVLAKKNQIIDPKMLDMFRKNNISTVYVKSMITAPTKEGVPATAVGLTTEGTLPKKGLNVGVQYVQAITEPLSQETLNLFHTGSVVKGQGGHIGNIVETVQYFTRLSESKRDISATLSTKFGRVTKIEKLPQGGAKVYVDDVPHVVSYKNDVIVKVGDIVKKGQPLSTGPVHPVDFLQVRNNPYEAMMSLSTQLTKALNNGGIKVPMVATEPIARSLLGNAVVLDNGGITEVEVGNYYPVSFLDSLNKKYGQMSQLPPKQAIGYRTAEHYGSVLAGTLIDRDIAEELESQGLKTVKVYKDKIKYKIVVSGSQLQVAHRNEWIHKMTSGRIAQNLTWAAATGEKTNIKKTLSPGSKWLIGSF